jgi:DNA topoisomerase-1
MTLVDRIHKTGIRRLGGKASGFRYARAGGGAVTAADRKRIDALKIPPAWRAVAIHPSPRGAVQAIGKDAAGRWQYVYHPARTARSEKKKYARLLRFAQALPKMRARIAADLALAGLPRDKVLACAVKVLSDCFMRGGSAVYAQEHGSYGLATLRRRHVTMTGDLVRFDFPGKSGKRQQREIRDRRVARIVGELVKGPGKVFKYRDEGGAWVAIRRRHLNAYIKEAMGEAFSAKDFRTWAGTLLCACSLARAEADPEQAGTARKKKIVRAIRETAERLGNTPAICRASYISPLVLRGYEKGGRVIDRTLGDVQELVSRRSPSLHRAEKALLRLLRRKA